MPAQDPSSREVTDLRGATNRANRGRGLASFCRETRGPLYLQGFRGQTAIKNCGADWSVAWEFVILAPFFRFGKAPFLRDSKVGQFGRPIRQGWGRVVRGTGGAKPSLYI